MRGDQVAAGQRDHAEQHVDGTPTPLDRPGRLHRPGRAEQLGRLVQRAPPPQQLGQAVDGEQRVAGDVLLRAPSR